MKPIQPQPIGNCAIQVPGSKSYTHRMLIAAALADGESRLANCLDSEDTRLTRQALEKMGICIQADKDALMVHGRAGHLAACAEPIYLANSGTSMRLLTAVAALGNGTYTLTGTPRMGQRPIQDLLDGLRQIHVDARSVEDNGCPPVQIQGGPVQGGPMTLNCAVSSQYLTAVLLIAPYTLEGLEITVAGGPVSRPYIDMTIDLMTRLGGRVAREGYARFKIPGRQVYQAGNYRVEPDASNASYFWAAAAITGAAVKVLGIDRASCQGDLRFLDLLAQMGCQIEAQPDGVTVIGGPLTGIEADMADLPDMVPTLAVVAAFAQGTTRIVNVSHLKAKESDRLAAPVTELRKMGIQAEHSDTGMIIRGGNPKGASIATYDDHRMAMSFAVAGLRVPGIIIENEMCVEKSFPTFWQVFERLTA